MSCFEWHALGHMFQNVAVLEKLSVFTYLLFSHMPLLHLFRDMNINCFYLISLPSISLHILVRLFYHLSFTFEHFIYSYNLSSFVISFLKTKKQNITLGIKQLYLAFLSGEILFVIFSSFPKINRFLLTKFNFTEAKHTRQ